jgi:hypothetical protein
LSTYFVKLALLSHALCIEHTLSLPPGYPGCAYWEGSCSVLGEPPPCGLVGLTGARRNCRQLRGSSQIACHAGQRRIGARSRAADEGRDAAGSPAGPPHAARSRAHDVGQGLPLGWSEGPAAATAGPRTLAHAGRPRLRSEVGPDYCATRIGMILITSGPPQRI